MQTQIIAPVLLPPGIVVLVTSIAEAQHIIELVRHFLPERIVDGELVIVNHTLEIVCPRRECVAGYFTFVDEFLNPT